MWLLDFIIINFCSFAFKSMKTTLCVYIGTQNGIKLVGETFAVCRISVKTTKLFSHVAFIVYGILCFIHPSATPFFVIYSYVYTYACYQIPYSVKL